VFFLALQIFSSFSSRVLEVKQKSELKFVLANLCFAVLWIRNDFFSDLDPTFQIIPDPVSDPA